MALVEAYTCASGAAPPRWARASTQARTRPSAEPPTAMPLAATSERWPVNAVTAAVRNGTRSTASASALTASPPGCRAWRSATPGSDTTAGPSRSASSRSSSTSMCPCVRKTSSTIASASPISAAATTMVNSANVCPPWSTSRSWASNATKLMFTAFSISSTPISTSTALRRASTPYTPIANSRLATSSGHHSGISGPSSPPSCQAVTSLQPRQRLTSRRGVRRRGGGTARSRPPARRAAAR